MTAKLSESSRASPGTVPGPRRCGFTLIELVTSITVGVIISGIAGSLIWNASRQRAEIAARGELSDAGATALEVMVRHVRGVSEDADKTGKAQITSPTATGFLFDRFLFSVGSEYQADLDSGSISQSLRDSFADYDITLSQTATVAVQEAGVRWLITDAARSYLIRNEAGKLSICGKEGLRLNGDAVEISADSGTHWYPLVADVSSLTFSYLDRVGGVLASFPPSNPEDIRFIRIDIELSRASQTAKLRTSIYLRNLMEEVNPGG
ncbi:MAG: prepilin-type N-terminal cleavage/methylation domain-containing protein [Phycisphaerae bacterium]|nr:prepilin-type N-terminal cleavage/methylation domain-containing protein [Phycisphaerae bacterium]